MTILNKHNFKDWIDNSQKRTLIMGILNVTPDSFSDGGKYLSAESSINRALEMIENGADIIDIGGESTRPGSDMIDSKTEISRVLPVVKKLRDLTNILISIDTRKSKVAEQALSAGANLINDVSGLTFDKSMIDVAKYYDCPIVIMHMKGVPKTMQNNPLYSNILDEVKSFFKTQINYANNNNFDISNIILDPGIGFGKSFKDNFYLINNLKEIRVNSHPILLGTSRKAFLGQDGVTHPENRIAGTAATIAIGQYNGANILRIHDVNFMKQVSLITNRICDQ